MPAYFIADVEWTDPGARAEYVRDFLPTLAPFGGEVIINTRDPEVVEGDWRPKGGIVVARFPSIEQARAWYDSETYRPLCELRLRASHSNSLLVEGLEPRQNQS